MSKQEAYQKIEASLRARLAEIEHSQMTSSQKSYAAFCAQQQANYEKWALSL